MPLEVVALLLFCAVCLVVTSVLSFRCHYYQLDAYRARAARTRLQELWRSASFDSEMRIVIEDVQQVLSFGEPQMDVDELWEYVDNFREYVNQRKEKK